jgi:hypothetical protein
VGAAQITVEFAFLGTRTGNGTISAWQASQMCQNDDDYSIECVSARTPGSEQWRITTRLKGQITGDSGVVTTGVGFPAAGVQDKAGIEITITAGGVDFAVGDVFELKTKSSDEGLFQSFFRDGYERPLPYVLDGTETISDSLAQ